MSSAMRLLSAYVFMTAHDRLWFTLTKTHKVLCRDCSSLVLNSRHILLDPRSSESFLMKFSKFFRESGDIITEWAMGASYHIPCKF
jgi:hypothetical protein